MKDKQGGSKPNEKDFCITRFIITFVCMLAFLIMPYGKVSAQLADGTYDINYVIQKAENDSASMANDYFENQLS